MARRTPITNPADNCTEPEEFLALVRSASPYLYEEDANMGDEAFVYLREDPEFFLIINR